MAGFKDILAEDLKVFVNLDEFADVHLIEECEVNCVVDSEILEERSGGDEFGIAENSIQIFAKTVDLIEQGIEMRGFGAHLLVDGREYMVISWTENAGMSSIALSQAVMN